MYLLPVRHSVSALAGGTAGQWFDFREWELLISPQLLHLSQGCGIACIW
jgi:hypothetical protein